MYIHIKQLGYTIYVHISDEMLKEIYNLSLSIHLYNEELKQLHKSCVCIHLPDDKLEFRFTDTIRLLPFSKVVVSLPLAENLYNFNVLRLQSHLRSVYAQYYKFIKYESRLINIYLNVALLAFVPKYS